MIDWRLVVTNFIWIAGAAILVWTWSYNRAVPMPSARRNYWIGFLLVCLGQTLVGGRWWEIAGWAALMLWSALQLRGVLKVANDHA